MPAGGGGNQRPAGEVGGGIKRPAASEVGRPGQAGPGGSLALPRPPAPGPPRPAGTAPDHPERHGVPAAPDHRGQDRRRGATANAFGRCFWMPSATRPRPGRPGVLGDGGEGQAVGVLTETITAANSTATAHGARTAAPAASAPRISAVATASARIGRIRLGPPVRPHACAEPGGERPRTPARRPDPAGRDRIQPMRGPPGRPGANVAPRTGVRRAARWPRMDAPQDDGRPVGTAPGRDRAAVEARPGAVAAPDHATTAATQDRRRQAERAPGRPARPAGRARRVTAARARRRPRPAAGRSA